MKKGTIIGVSIVSGIAVVGIVVLAIVLAATTGFEAKEDGFKIPAGNYSRYVSECDTEILTNQMTGLDATKWDADDPYETKTYTEDGYPVWEYKQSYWGLKGYKSKTFICRLGTTATSAYPIDLLVDGEVVKTFAQRDIYNKNGEKL